MKKETLLQIILLLVVSGIIFVIVYPKYDIACTYGTCFKLNKFTGNSTYYLQGEWHK